jgi:hypothetical protein
MAKAGVAANKAVMKISTRFLFMMDTPFSLS